MGWLSGLEVIKEWTVKTTLEEMGFFLCLPRPIFSFSDAERENSTPTEPPAPIGRFDTFSPSGDTQCRSVIIKQEC